MQNDAIKERVHSTAETDLFQQWMKKLLVQNIVALSCVRFS